MEEENSVAHLISMARKRSKVGGIASWGSVQDQVSKSKSVTRLRSESASVGSVGPFPSLKHKKRDYWNSEAAETRSLGSITPITHFPLIREKTVDAYTQPRSHPADMRFHRRFQGSDNRNDEEGFTTLKRAIENAKKDIRDASDQNSTATPISLSKVTYKRAIKFSPIRSRNPSAYGDLSQRTNTSERDSSSTEQIPKSDPSKQVPDLTDLSQLEVSSEDLIKGQAILEKHRPWLFDSSEFSARIPSLKARNAVEDICTREMIQARILMVDMCRLQRQQKLVMGELPPEVLIPEKSNRRGKKVTQKALADVQRRGAKASMSVLQPKKLDIISPLSSSVFKFQQYAELRRDFLLECQMQETVCMQAEEMLARQVTRYNRAVSRMEDYTIYFTFACRWGPLDPPTFNRTIHPGQAYTQLINHTATKIMHWWFFWYPIRLYRKRKGAAAVQKLIRGALTRKKWRPIVLLRLRIGRTQYLRKTLSAWKRFWHVRKNARILLINHFKRIMVTCFYRWRSYLRTLSKHRFSIVQSFLFNSSRIQKLRILRTWSCYAHKMVVIMRMFCRAVQAPRFAAWIVYTNESKCDKGRIRVALFLQSRYRGYLCREKYRCLRGIVKLCRALLKIRQARRTRRLLFNEFVEKELDKCLLQRKDAQIIEMVNDVTQKLNKLEESILSSEALAITELNAYFITKNGKKELTAEQRRIQDTAKLKKEKISSSEAKQMAANNIIKLRQKSMRLVTKHDFWASVLNNSSCCELFRCIRPQCEHTFVVEDHYIRHEKEAHPNSRPCAALHCLLIGRGTDDCESFDLEMEQKPFYYVMQWANRHFGLTPNLWLLQMWTMLQEWKRLLTASTEYMQKTAEIIHLYLTETSLCPIAHLINFKVQPLQQGEMPLPNVFEGLEYACVSYLQKEMLEKFLGSEIWRQFVKSKKANDKARKKDSRPVVMKDIKRQTQEWASHYKREVLQVNAKEQKINQKCEEVMEFFEEDIVSWLLTWGQDTTQRAEAVVNAVEECLVEKLFLDATETEITREQEKQRRLDEELRINIENKTEALLWKLEKALADWLIDSLVKDLVNLQNIADDAVDMFLNKVSEEMIKAALTHIVSQKEKQLGVAEADNKKPLYSVPPPPLPPPLAVIVKTSDSSVAPLKNVPTNSAAAASAMEVPIPRFKAITKNVRDMVETPYTKKHNKAYTDSAALKIQMLVRRHQARKRLKHLITATIVKKYDKTSGYFYYENKKTGESTWDPPIILKRMFPRSRF